ncbi:MAG: YdcF family protein [Anaerolineae bacterium]|nr:YdcF family protein [Anaerolineae bacterium]
MAEKAGRWFAPVTRIWRWFWRSPLRLPVLAGIAAIGLVALAMGLALHAFGQVNSAAPADVIVVLGAGLEPDGQPSGATARRARHAAALYHAGAAPALICSGGYALDWPLPEATGCAAVLRDEGVPEAAIWLEAQAKSTEENAIYSGALMAAQGWRSALVVSDRYHLLRAQLLFAQQGVPVAGFSPAQETSGPISVYEYGYSLRREITALYWQGFKTLFNLPYTYVPFF